MLLVSHTTLSCCALLVLASATAHAESTAAGLWAASHQEQPAPTPAASATPAAAAIVKHPARERAARIHKHGAVVATARDVPPAPTPIAEAEAPKSGPIETGAPTLRDLVTKHARANGVPETLAAAVVNIESRFNPRARGGSAVGLMQIQYNTARSVGYVGGVMALMAPETNLHFGMKVLADAYKASHGDLCMTLARYQSGHLVTRPSAANRAYCAKAKTYMARAS